MPRELLLWTCLERVAGAELRVTPSFSIVVPVRAVWLSHFGAISLAKLPVDILAGLAHSTCRDLSVHRGSMG